MHRGKRKGMLLRFTTATALYHNKRTGACLRLVSLATSEYKGKCRHEHQVGSQKREHKAPFLVTIDRIIETEPFYSFQHQLRPANCLELH